MKAFRIVGLLVIAFALVGGATESARATAPVTCYKTCSGVPYYTNCWSSLSQCCHWNRICPDGYTYEGDGYCTDGTSELFC